jgi:hypothetical protein
MFKNELVLCVFENRNGGQYFDPGGESHQQIGGICIMRSNIVCTVYQLLLGKSNSGLRASYVAQMGEQNSILVGKHENYRSFGR